MNDPQHPGAAPSPDNVQSTDLEYFHIDSKALELTQWCWGVQAAAGVVVVVVFVEHMDWQDRSCRDGVIFIQSAVSERIQMGCQNSGWCLYKCTLSTQTTSFSCWPWWLAFKGFYIHVYYVALFAKVMFGHFVFIFDLICLTEILCLFSLSRRNMHLQVHVFLGFLAFLMQN